MSSQGCGLDERRHMLQTPPLEGPPCPAHGLCILARKNEQWQISVAQCPGTRGGEDGKDTGHGPESSNLRSEQELDLRQTASTAFWVNTAWIETQEKQTVSAGQRVVWSSPWPMDATDESKNYGLSVYNLAVFLSVF